MWSIYFVITITSLYLFIIGAIQAHGQDQETAPCSSIYQGQAVPIDALVEMLERHAIWVDDPEHPDGERANLCGADLSSLDLSEINLRKANLQQVNLYQSVLQQTNLSRADLRGTNLRETDLQQANLNGANLQQAQLGDANLSQAFLNEANLTEANLDEADLWQVYLLNANLNAASLVRTSLVETTLSNVDLSQADFNGADLYQTIFEPQPGKLPAIAELALAKNLAFMTFSSSPHGLAELREAFKVTGMRPQERDVTYALKRGERLQAPLLEQVFHYVLFEITCQYGRAPGHALIILIVLMFIFALPYLVALKQASKRAGIWVNVNHPDKTRQYLLKPRICKKSLIPPASGKRLYAVRMVIFRFRQGWRYVAFGIRLFRISLYFSLLSSFRIGWNDFDIRQWILNLQTREYVMEAHGWVRTVAGVQSLTSVYLWVMWVATYFGRPFE